MKGLIIRPTLKIFNIEIESIYIILAAIILGIFTLIFGIEAAFYGFLYWTGMAMVIFFLVNSYRYFTTDKNKVHLQAMLFTALISIAIGSIFFYFYGRQLLMRGIGFAVVFFILMLANLTRWNPLQKN